MLSILAIIALQEGARKLLIVGARNNAVGGNVQVSTGSSQHYLPLKVNPAGVLPIIFASMTMLLPSQLLGFIKVGDTGLASMKFSTAMHTLFTDEASAVHSVGAWVGEHDLLVRFLTQIGTFIDNIVSSQTSWEHSVVVFLLILMFAFFYASILLNPREMAENLQKGGSAVQGVKPGKPTGDYLEYLVTRLVFIGGSAIALITVLPIHVGQACKVTTMAGLGSTSLIIMVGVAIDLYNQVIAYMQAHQYQARSLLLR